MIAIRELAEAGALLVRTTEMSADVEAQVDAILRDVAARGDAAVQAYTERFDRRVPQNGSYELPRATWAAHAAAVALDPRRAGPAK